MADNKREGSNVRPGIAEEIMIKDE